MQGLHLTADLRGCQCDSAWLLDAPLLGVACRDAVQAAGLQAVGALFHGFLATAQGLMEALVRLFAPTQVQRQSLQRGTPAAV
jgi:hypothetical protein